MWNYNYKKATIIALAVALLVAMFYRGGSTEIISMTLAFSIINSIIMTAGIWGGCVWIVKILWRNFPWEHSPFKHLIVEIVAIILWVLVIVSLRLYIGEYIHAPSELETNSIPVALDIFVTMLITFLITAIHEAIFFYRQWKINFSKSAKLEKDNMEAKYETLKAQINPHFLFNSLNSLSYMVDDNKKAINHIQNLSDVLRYVLKSHENELISLREEINILNKYLDIQKSRFLDKLIIEMSIDDECLDYQVPPLAVQMLVENCIKHNIISAKNPLTISIVAKNENIVVENNLQVKTTKDSTGHGLKNISERFAFFSNKAIEINETKHTFSVQIPLLTIS